MAMKGKKIWITYILHHNYNYDNYEFILFCIFLTEYQSLTHIIQAVLSSLTFLTCSKIAVVLLCAITIHLTMQNVVCQQGQLSIQSLLWHMLGFLCLIMRPILTKYSLHNHNCVGAMYIQETKDWTAHNCQTICELW